MMTSLTQQLTAVGSHGFSPRLAPALTVDNRPPLVGSPGLVQDSHDTYEIIINPTSGMDPQAIGRAVRTELERIEREKAARRRGRLTDLE